MIDNFVRVNQEKLSEISVDSKYFVKDFNEFLDIGIPYLLKKLIVVSWFPKESKIYFFIKMS